MLHLKVFGLNPFRIISIVLIFFLGAAASGAGSKLPYDFPKEYYVVPGLPKTSNNESLFLAKKEPLEDIYLKRLEEENKPLKEVNIFGAKGQYVPFSFVIFANRNIPKISANVGKLINSQGKKIGQDSFGFLMGMRQEQPETGILLGGKHVVTTRFLPPLEPFDLAGNTFRELYGIAKVPNDASPGIYTGLLEVTSDNHPIASVKISLEVFPFHLKKAPNKKFGMYYQIGDSLTMYGGEKKQSPDNPSGRKRVRLELAQMRQYQAADILLLGAGIRYEATPGGVTISYDEITRALGLCREAGLPQAQICVLSRFENLARLLGHPIPGWTPGKPMHGAAFEDLSGAPRFYELAKKALLELRQVQQQYPEYELILRHYTDEIDYPLSLLPLYIELTKAARQVPGVKMYVTYQLAYRPKRTERLEKLQHEVAPYVDIRAHAGEFYEWWLLAGANPQDYAKEVHQRGGEAWLYYNPDAPIRNAHYYRLINGLGFWSQEAITGLVPWAYFYHRRGQREVYDAFADNLEHRGEIGFAFPSWKDGITPVATRILEGFREGVYDLSYLYTLSEVVKEAKARRTNSPKVGEAENWLIKVNGLYPAPDTLYAEERHFDPAWRPGVTNYPAPITGAAKKRLSLEELDKIRYQTAKLIDALQGELKP